MTWALPYLLLGAIAFVGQELPGAWVAPGKASTGEVSTNFRQADLNGDGKTDLVFARKVAFQRDNVFPEEAEAPLPDFGGTPRMDVWNGALYVWLPNRLEVFQWDGKTWRAQFEQELAWPEEGADSGGGATDGGGALSGGALQRFVVDLNGDKTPELAAVSPEGVVFYQRTGDSYALYKRYNVLPQLRLAEQTEQTLWPQAARRIGVPVREMTCRLLLEPAALTVFVREDGPDGQSVYRSIGYPLGPDDSHTNESVSGAIPPYLYPCRLTGDAQIDFAGGRWQSSELSLQQALVYETWASLDGGKRFHVRRSRSFQNFRPQTSFVDFDGDGRLDMITESTGIFDGGVREAVARFLTESSIGHEVNVYRQDEAGFSESPSVHARFTIGLSRPPIYDDGDFTRYQMGDLFNMTGDFNGDHVRDAAVQCAPGHVAVHLTQGGVISSTPAVDVKLAARGILTVFDLNGDGRSDLLLRWNSMEEGKRTEHCMAYFAGEAGP